tara:strand:- start:18 stop:215 length:198 start_codon:yes stop_codon:yes gene_type:complete
MLLSDLSTRLGGIVIRIRAYANQYRLQYYYFFDGVRKIHGKGGKNAYLLTISLYVWVVVELKSTY